MKFSLKKFKKALTFSSLKVVIEKSPEAGLQSN